MLEVVKFKDNVLTERIATNENSTWMHIRVHFPQQATSAFINPAAEHQDARVPHNNLKPKVKRFHVAACLHFGIPITNKCFVLLQDSTATLGQNLLCSILFQHSTLPQEI